jgi:hypothetical protein
MISKIGRAVLWTALLLAGFMVASGVGPDSDSKLTVAQTLGAALFVVVCGGVLGGALLLVGRRIK